MTTNTGNARAIEELLALRTKINEKKPKPCCGTDPVAREIRAERAAYGNVASWIGDRLAALRAAPSPEPEMPVGMHPGILMPSQCPMSRRWRRISAMGGASSKDSMPERIEITVLNDDGSESKREFVMLLCSDDLEGPTMPAEPSPEPQRASISRDFVDRVRDRVGTSDFGDAKPEDICAAVLAEAGIEPQRASAGLVEAAEALLANLPAAGCCHG